jgi:hypothetical protein
LNETGLLVRFAIGDIPPGYEAQIEEEESRYGTFLRIPGKVGSLALGRMYVIPTRSVPDHKFIFSGFVQYVELQDI